MAEISRRTKILLALGLAGAASALTLGGVAYAVGGSGDSPGESAYVIVDGADATTTDTTPETTPDTTPDEGTQPRGERDCPEKDGQGGGQGSDTPESAPETAPETAPDNSNAADRA